MKILTTGAILAAIEAGFDVYVEADFGGHPRMIKADSADLHRRLASDPDGLDAAAPAWLGCEKTLYLGSSDFFPPHTNLK